MPIVSESYNSPSIVVPTSKNGSSQSCVIPGAVSKTQTGFRTRSLTPAEERGISEGSHTAADTLSLVSAYEQVGYEFLPHKERAFVVNDRDASKVTRQHGTFTSVTKFRPTDADTVCKGTISIESLQGVTIPPWPSSPVLQSRAAQMMRRSVPTTAEINLTRAVGELRQAPQMFRAANYRPRNLREAGGAYLNYVFGIAPTVSDLSAAADAVVTFDAVLQAYISQEKNRTRRIREMELWSDSGSGYYTQKSSDFFLNSRLTGIGPFSVRESFILPGSTSGFNNVLRPQLAWSWAGHQSLRMFATFEYFIPKPQGLEGRLSRYRQLATRVVGGGLDASTAYDLTPWTWLGNYFSDVGGLLRYQQAVADHQIVASSAGYSVYEELGAKVSYTARHYDPTGVAGAWPVTRDTITPSVATYRRVIHRRRKGNPYDISPDWNLDPQQWAILGALGLARGPGVPLKR